MGGSLGAAGIQDEPPSAHSSHSKMVCCVESGFPVVGRGSYEYPCRGCTVCSSSIHRTSLGGSFQSLVSPRLFRQPWAACTCCLRRRLFERSFHMVDLRSTVVERRSSLAASFRDHNSRHTAPSPATCPLGHSPPVCIGPYNPCNNHRYQDIRRHRNMFHSPP